MTDPVAEEKGAKKSDQDEDAPKTPLFLFFSCKTSGRSFMRHKILDIAVHCWPYSDDAPVFYRRINHNAGKRSEKTRSKNPASDDDRDTVAICVLKELLQWIDSTVEQASSALGLTTLYPVLIAHEGETFQFLFLFRMLETYGISAAETLEAHSVHFADPVPVLKQYKEARHTWLVDSRSLGLGSLLNDWFPAQFDEADLMFSRTRNTLTLKLYTQSPLYWILYRIPIYNTQEWIKFYEGEKFYQEDKWELQENIPSSIGGVRRKMTIRHLLKYGYSWSSLIDLYKSCGSPQHFRQELRDMDIKTAAAGRITFAIVAMNLEQDGSREYKVRIRSNMRYAKYYHLTDVRGRHFILRVANVLPPCFFTVADLCDDRWKVPDSLLKIGTPDMWDAMIDSPLKDLRESHRDDIGDEQPGVEKADHHLDTELGGDSDSEADWDTYLDPDSPALDGSELPNGYFMEPVPAYVPTTLVRGVGGVNPFAFPEQEWLAVDRSEQKADPNISTNGDCSANCSASNSQSETGGISASANPVASAGIQTHSANHQSSSSCKPAWTNHRDRPRSRHSTPANQSSCTSPRSHHSAWTNQSDSAMSPHSISTNQISPTSTMSAKQHQTYSTNQACCTSTGPRNSRRSHDATWVCDKQSERSRHYTPANQISSVESHPSRAANHSSPNWSHDPSSTSSGLITQGAVPRETSHGPPKCQSKKKSTNQKTSMESHASATANHRSPNQSHSPSTSSPELCRDKVFHPQGAFPKEPRHHPPRFQSKKKNTRKKTRRDS